MSRHIISERAVDDFLFKEMFRVAKLCKTSPIQSRKTRTDVVVDGMAAFLHKELSELMLFPDKTRPIFSMTSDSWTSQSTKRK
jgi:hypothetical protein